MLLVVTEGSVTEPEYLRAFVRACRNPRVRIEVHKGMGMPQTIVEHARNAREQAQQRARREGDDNLAYDEVWCVFDIDQHPNIDPACQLATALGLNLAISNPCIELWLLLHFADAPGQVASRQLEEMLRRHVKAYDKHVNYLAYQAGYEAAVERAGRLDTLADSIGEPGRNPTTGMYLLTESIRESS